MVENLARVRVLNNTYSKELHLMYLIYILVLLASRYDVWFSASHIEGKVNILADAGSVNSLHVLFSQPPQSTTQSSTHSSLALVTTIALCLAWICVDWIKLLNSTMQQL